MPRPLYAALACAAVLADISTSVRAQTLAEVARKEEDRRKAIGNPSKVYTNADLKPVPKSAAPPPAASEKKDGDGKNDDKKDEKKDAADKDKDAAPKDAAKDAAANEPAKPLVKDQAYWAERQKTLQEQLARDETYAEALQSRINALTTDFVNRDDPAQKRVIEQTRLTAIAALDRLKQRIPEDKKAIADFQDEARRAGVPAGWLR